MNPNNPFSSAATLARRAPAARPARDGSRCWHTLGSKLALAAVIAMASGCENAQQGAVTGASVGALSGLAIGSMSGNAGRGAATGAIIGGVGGAATGDQNRRRNEEAARQPAHTTQTIVVQQQPVAVTTTVRHSAPMQTVVVQQSYLTGSALGRLVGQWNVSGTMDAGNGQTLPVHGTARATVDNNFFVRLDLQFVDPRSGEAIDGTMVINQTGQRGVELTSSFSTSPDVRRYRGEMDPSGNVLNFNQVSPPNSSRRIVMRLSSGIEWTAEAWDRGNRVESYTFTWIGPS